MKHYHCPVNGWDCPYYQDHDYKDKNHGCLCTCEDPFHNCSDFYDAWEGYEPEDYTDDDEE